MSNNNNNKCGLRSAFDRIELILTDKTYKIIPFNIILFIILFGELLLGILIIEKVPYTEIDWKAYMQEVSGVINGERDYLNLRGDTGPLVYPAGFVYIYSILYYITNNGVNIYLAQYIFLFIYLLFVYIILKLYKKSNMIPPWVLILVCLSRRIHSIFMLRLFNDGIAMLFAYCSFLLFMNDRWSIGCIIYSLGVSIKMNVFLFAPGLLILLLKRFGWLKTIWHLILCALPQIILGLPFLMTYPTSYLGRSFELGRQFIYKWTVNWKIIPESFFLSSSLSRGLLIYHLIYLAFFAHYHWCKYDNYGMFSFILQCKKSLSKKLKPHSIILCLFTCQFIGIVFCRSLHFQFYTWYYHTLPFLLWNTNIYPFFRLVLLGIIEWVWNVYPATPLTSASLHVVHIIILLGLWFKPMPIEYVSNRKLKTN